MSRTKQQAEKTYNAIERPTHCAICAQRRKLEAHHLDPSTKVSNIADMVWRGKPIASIQAELSKCVWLCYDCHTNLHIANGDNPVTMGTDEQRKLWSTVKAMLE